MKKYIAQQTYENFVYPNNNVQIYDNNNVVQAINNNSVTGVVNSLNYSLLTTTGATFTYNLTWNKNGAEDFIRNDGQRAIASIQMLPKGQIYYQPWRTVAVENSTNTTGNTVTVSGTFSVTALEFGLPSTGFTEGNYTFEVKFIGSKTTYPVTVVVTAMFATPTPTPSPTVTLTPTPSATPTVTPTPTATTIPPTATPTPTPIFYYYIVEPCDGGEQIFIRTSTETDIGNAIKIGGFCYEVVNTTISGTPLEDETKYIDCATCGVFPPTNTPTPTPTATPTFYYFNATPCGGGDSVVVKSLINHSFGTVGIYSGSCYTIDSSASPTGTIIDVTETVVSCADPACGPTPTPTFTPTPTATPTVTPTPTPVYYYYTLQVCNSIEELTGRNLTLVSNGTVVKIAGTCYTILNSTAGPVGNDIDLTDVYASCAICDPSPTVTPTPTPTATPVYYYFNATPCGGGDSVVVKSLINHSFGTVGIYSGSCYTVNSSASPTGTVIDITETVPNCEDMACGLPATATPTPTAVPPTATPTPTAVPPTDTPTPTPLPPTDTPTPTPLPPTDTPTPTPIPPTHTPTPTPIPPTDTPTPTPEPEPPTNTPTPTPLPFFYFNATPCEGGGSVLVKSLINHVIDTVGLYDGSCYTIDSAASAGATDIDVTETVPNCFDGACG